MEIIKIVSFAFISLFLVLILRGRRDELAVQLSIAAGALIFLFMVTKITAVMELLQQLALKANIDFVYLNTVFKILGIAYLASFCSEVCRDAGESSLASKVEFGGKILILVLAIPILMGVLNSILKII
ncbi:stage III sporulation protein AD [Clostridium pasteurianum DSM 525 = ATCC 6013]|uniref:Stage III sporulation protein AD n=1 Tax=Clostridium pasteurianum DSM 525 = ATCC 6013 TaxID=1262449 RepID=A0A0H3J9T8_CLOPA|nr:stage III sporulation protein AD [Clostridium pasteurianum]AJA47970.1 stage III sporulation protein AD [Clostridium pasteurianum DSM 525 = ATCC 6013]AJA51958.1 stage III sporulation protein AD [Clostridium pasteurianum DSM 525 = ATCC 6013]AOZ75255.1 stage III sporulation protein AD [Clostridium pasteurianum DSM 525 = ATCC 6013]AOZ79050.1 stage III sporulation protein AD [Clostridium pasteurianum]ELP59873.1 stage III sporulation protein AD [Clostridium pasteurianum DSM 525 = ATCC 6013]